MAKKAKKEASNASSGSLNFDNKNFAKNMILYGPPGTGKTYNSVVKAMEIVNPSIIKTENNKISNYDEILNAFNEEVKKEDGRIKFVTFHQSYSYEEFVEGIKPKIKWDSDDEEVKYIGKDGIFKKICKQALNGAKIKVNTKEPSIEDLFNEFKRRNPPGTELKTYAKYSSFKIENYTLRGFKITPKDGRTYPITLAKFKEVYRRKPDKQSDITNIRTANSYGSYYFAIYQEIKKIENDLKKSQSIEQREAYVLVIDEINRGNISKILGELITLIEDDKREKMSVILPYSQAEFTVPENLYIIGTMNTSDRSIASIDIALRRRFEFEPMYPIDELVIDDIGGIKFRNVFKKLNKAIDILLDADHQIGHSYFMKNKIKTIGDLKEIWFKKILPLLNEYFYEDWDKLELIIPSFIKKIEIKNKKFEEHCDYLYQFKNEKDFSEVDFKNALNKIGIDIENAENNEGDSNPDEE